MKIVLSLILTSLLFISCSNEVAPQNVITKIDKFLLPLDFRYNNIPVGDEKFVPINCTQGIKNVLRVILTNENIDKNSESFLFAQKEQTVFNAFNQRINELEKMKDINAEDKQRRAAVYLSEAFLEYRKINPAAHQFCIQNLELKTFNCRLLPSKKEMVQCLRIDTQNALQRLAEYRVNQFRKKPGN